MKQSLLLDALGPDFEKVLFALAWSDMTPNFLTVLHICGLVSVHNRGMDIGAWNRWMYTYI